MRLPLRLPHLLHLQVPPVTAIMKHLDTVAVLVVAEVEDLVVVAEDMTSVSLNFKFAIWDLF